MKGTREVIAFAFIPIAMGAIVFLPSWVYLAMIWTITMLSARELLVLLRRLGQPAPLAPTLVALGLMLPVLWTVGLHKAGAVMALVLLVMPAAYLFGRYPIGGAAAAITGATFTALYFLVTGGAMGLLRTAFEGTTGTKTVLIHCLTIWGCDSGAYYVGSNFGRHRLAPNVSPNKSWEGILGGIALAAFGVWFCRTVFFHELPLGTAMALFLAVSVLAPIGDLVESVFKRDAGVKDSSDLIPGHGGFLDRTDSLFFAAPFVLALFILLGVSV
jgi:phosphatidate cytidylyltransferase